MEGEESYSPTSKVQPFDEKDLDPSGVAAPTGGEKMETDNGQSEMAGEAVIDEAEATPELSPIIPAGFDNYEQFDANEITMKVGENFPGAEPMARVMLINALQADFREPSLGRLLGTVPGYPNVYYYVPPVAAVSLLPNVDEPQPVPTDFADTRNIKLVDDGWLSWLWKHRPDLEKCHHTDEPECGSGCCVKLRKRYLCAFYSNPITVHKTATGFAYTNVERRKSRDQGKVKREKQRQEKIEKLQQKVQDNQALEEAAEAYELEQEAADQDAPSTSQQKNPEQPQGKPPKRRKTPKQVPKLPPREPYTGIGNVGPEYKDWYKKPRDAEKPRITCYVEKNHANCSILKVHECSWDLFCKMWTDAGFTEDKGFPAKPTFMGILFPGRVHKKVLTTDPNFFEGSPTFFKTPELFPVSSTGVTQEYYQNIFSQKVANLPWNVLLPEGAQLDIQADCFLTYRDPSWHKGQDAPPVKPGWEDRLQPCNWVVDKFTLARKDYHGDYGVQPVVYAAPGSIFAANDWRHYRDTLFRKSKNPSTREYFEWETKRAAEERRKIDPDYKQLLLAERPDFANSGKPPDDLRTVQSAKACVGCPPHATALPSGPKRNEDPVSQASMVSPDHTETLFAEGVAREDIDRDFSTNGLIRTDHNIRDFQLRYANGKAVVRHGSKKRIILKFEPCIVLWTYVVGMPPGKLRRDPIPSVVQCIVGRGAVRHWAHSLAPQHNKIPFRLPQLCGCELFDERFITALCARAALSVAEMKYTNLLNQRAQISTMVRVTGRVTDPTAELVVPRVWDTRLTMLRAKESAQIKLKTFTYGKKGGLKPVISNWRIQNVHAAWRFDHVKAKSSRNNFLKSINCYDPVWDPADHTQLVHDTSNITVDQMPPGTDFKWDPVCDMDTIERAGFQPPAPYHHLWQPVGSLVQLKQDTITRVAATMVSGLLTKNRYFVASSANTTLAQLFFQHIAPTNFMKIIDTNHKRLQLICQRQGEIAEAQSETAKKRVEAANNSKYTFGDLFDRYAEGDGQLASNQVFGGAFTDNILEDTQYNPKWTQPRFKDLSRFPGTDPRQGKLTPLNFITYLVFGLVVAKEQDATRFMTDDQIDEELKHDWVRQIIYPRFEENGIERYNEAQARIIYRIVIARQPVCFVCGPPGCGKTTTIDGVLTALRRAKTIMHKQGFPPRETCHKDYHQIDPETGTCNLAPEREVTVIAAASNYATDQACKKRDLDFFGPESAPTGKTFFDRGEQEKHSVYFMRYHGMYDSVRSERCRVRKATFLEIIDSVPRDKLPPTLLVDLTEHDSEKKAAEEALEAMQVAEQEGDNQKVNQMQQEMVKHAKQRAFLVNKLFDGVLQYIPFDVIACTLSMAMDIKLRHPHINVRTVIIDEISQVTLDQVMGVKDLLHTRFEDPVLAMFGDSAQMPPTHNVGGRIDKLLNLDLMALRTDPADCIPKAFDEDPDLAWDKWELHEPKPTVDVCQLEVNYRNPEVMSGLLMHNYYIKDDDSPKFHTAEALQPRIKQTFADEDEAENKGYPRGVREILDPGSEVFRNPFIPWLVRGVPVALWDVCRSKEEQRLTSKSNDTIVDAVINMIYTLCYKMRVILPENLTVLTSYMGQKLDIEERIRTHLVPLCGEFTAKEYSSTQQHEFDEPGEYEEGAWTVREHATLADVKVETWDSSQGREFPYVIVTDPRAMSEARESRTVSTGVITKAQNAFSAAYPNTPVIDHELLEKDFRSHLDVLLGFTHSRHKFIVSNSRAQYGVFFIYDSHTRDLSKDWYTLTRWCDINGLTTFDYPQEIENAIAYSPHPPKWYEHGDMLMEGIDVIASCGAERTNLATVRDLPCAKYLPDANLLNPYTWPEQSFFRQLPEIKYKDFLLDGEIIEIVRTRPRMQDVTITRKDWNLVKPEPAASFNEWQDQNYIRPYDDLEPENQGDANIHAVLTEVMPEDVEIWRVDQEKMQGANMDTSASGGAPGVASGGAAGGAQAEDSDGEPDVLILSDDEEELEAPVADLPRVVAIEHFNIVKAGHNRRGAWSHPRFLQAVRQMQIHHKQFSALGTLPQLPDSHETLYRKELADLADSPEKLLSVLLPFVGLFNYEENCVHRMKDLLQFAKTDISHNQYKYTELVANTGVSMMNLRQAKVANTPVIEFEGVRYMLPYSPEQDKWTKVPQLTVARNKFKEGIAQEAARRKEQKAEAEKRKLRGKARSGKLDGRGREETLEQPFMSLQVGGRQQQRGHGRGRGRGLQQQQPSIRAQGPQGPQPSYHARPPLRGSKFNQPMVRAMHQPPHQRPPRFFQPAPRAPYDPEVMRQFLDYRQGLQPRAAQQQPPRQPGRFAPNQQPSTSAGGTWRAPQPRISAADLPVAQGIAFNLGKLSAMGSRPRAPVPVSQQHHQAQQYLAQQYLAQQHLAQQQPTQQQPAPTQQQIQLAQQYLAHQRPTQQQQAPAQEPQQQVPIPELQQQAQIQEQPGPQQPPTQPQQGEKDMDQTQ